MAWYDFLDDDETGAFDLGGFGDFSFEDTGAFDMGGIDLGGLDLGALNFDVGSFDLGGLDLGSLTSLDFGDAGAFDLGGLDLGGLESLNFGDAGAFDLGGLEGVDLSETGAFDLGGFEGIDLGGAADTGAFDISGALDLGGGRLEEGNLVFDTDQGKVIYTPEGTVQTVENDGGTQFYTTNEGKDYFIDYTDPSTLGEQVEVYGRDVGGEGPTRYTSYTGTGKDAKVVDYSDVYGPGGGTVTTTSGGKTTKYEDGKVFKDITSKDLEKDTTKTTKKNDDKKSFKDVLNELTGGKDNTAMLAALLGGILGLLNRPKGTGARGYKYGQLPSYKAVRGAPTEGIKLVQAAGGGLMGLAEGGSARPARYLRGGTDGMADKIQTNIDGKQPARLSHGEFVIPADVVSHLGNGNSDAGANVLYDMMAKVRKDRTGTTKQGKQINPRKYTPA